VTVTSPPTLTEAQILVKFQLAALTPASMHDAKMDVLFKVMDEAHGNIDVGFRGLSSAYQLDGTVQFPSYELCPNESELESIRAEWSSPLHSQVCVTFCPTQSTS
jgi:hypothetical protein